MDLEPALLLLIQGLMRDIGTHVSKLTPEQKRIYILAGHSLKALEHVFNNIIQLHKELGIQTLNDKYVEGEDDTGEILDEYADDTEVHIHFQQFRGTSSGKLKAGLLSVAHKNDEDGAALLMTYLQLGLHLNSAYPDLETTLKSMAKAMNLSSKSITKEDVVDIIKGLVPVSKPFVRKYNAQLIPIYNRLDAILDAETPMDEMNSVVFNEVISILKELPERPTDKQVEPFLGKLDSLLRILE